MKQSIKDTSIKDTRSIKDIVKDIGSYVLDGMTEDEACVLAKIKPEQLRSLKETNEVVREYLQIQSIKFKHNNLRTIADKKSDKNSQWLLEKLRPEQFGSTKKTSDTTINIVSAILKDIQNDPNAGILAPIKQEVVVLKDIKPLKDSVLNVHSVL